MSSLSKSKYNPGLNIYSLNKNSKDVAKTKTVTINYGGTELKGGLNSGVEGSSVNSYLNVGIGNLRHSGSNTNDLKSGVLSGNVNLNNHNNPNTANSFRQTGILGVKKFKTTKSSRN